MIYSDNRLLNEEIAHFVFETMNAVPAQERMGFKAKAQNVMSPKGNPVEQSKLANTLYRSIVKSAKEYEASSQTDMFSYAKASKGDVTKIKDWPRAEMCFNRLVGVAGSKKISPNVTLVSTMIDFRKMLLDSKADFEYGFKYHIDIIEILYAYMVESYYELIDAAIVALQEDLQDYAGVRPTKFSGYNGMIVVTSCQTLVNLYKTGEWKKFMKSFQNAKVAANESIVFDGLDGEFGMGVIEDDPFAALEGNVIIDKALGIIKTAGITIGVVVTVFFALRGLIAYFFHRAAKHRDHAENQAKLLDNILATDTSLTPEERDKIERKKIKLQETAANIDRKIFKADKAAKEDMRKESAAIAKAMTDDSGFVGINPGTASNATPSPDSDDFVIL